MISGSFIGYASGGIIGGSVAGIVLICGRVFYLNKLDKQKKEKYTHSVKVINMIAGGLGGGLGAILGRVIGDYLSR